jgi:hypothetical protein
MSESAQVIALLAACVCIAIFFTAFASTAIALTNGHNPTSEGLMIVCHALFVGNVLLTMHALVAGFSIVVALSGWLFAYIVKSVFSLPSTLKKTPAVSSKRSREPAPAKG